MTGRWRRGPALVGLAVSLWATACTNTVDGTAARRDAAPPGVLTERDLDDVLLDSAELAELLNSPDIEVTDEIDEMTDSSAEVSHPECLGALYSAEDPAYESTGYAAVLTRLAREPGDAYQHWVEESAVLVPTVEDAEQFVQRSAREWDDCAGRQVSVSDGEEWFDWELDAVERDGGMVIQASTILNSIDWQCQHTVAAVSNLIIEASVCAERIHDEATTVMAEMMAKASARTR